jgi:16S rRNA (adenine1518-N6/adenine1519-N6)-dimethyltransferase
LTSPILRKVCDWTGWDTATFMVQKEVGDRLVAKVSTAAYGALTAGVSLTCEMERVFDLSENSFKPPPRVKSTVVKLTRRQQPLTDNVHKVQRVIQAAFQQRRKTILNSLSHGLNLDKEKVERMLSAENIPVTARAENLTVQNYLALSTRF